MNPKPWGALPMMSIMCDKILKDLDDLRGGTLPEDEDEAELVLWQSFVEMEEARVKYEFALEKVEATRLNVAEIRIKILQAKIAAKVKPEMPPEQNPETIAKGEV